MRKVLIAMTLALASVPLVAQAQPRDGWSDTAQIEVPHGDLNLSSPVGAERMLGRIRQAAIRVCGGRPDLRDLREVRAFKACTRIAIERAVAELGAPLVTALYYGRDQQDRQLAGR
jgi:UrcA family protein